MIDIQKLAVLARLAIPDAEKESIAHDLESIISFVDQVQSRNISEQNRSFDRVNVFREDIVLPLAANYDLIAAAPGNQDHFVKVPKVME